MRTNERTSVYLLQSLCDAQWTRFPFSFVLHVACQQLMDCLNCLSPACPRLSVSLSPSLSLDFSFLLCLVIPVMTLHILLAFFLFTFYQGNSSLLFAQFSYLKMIWQLSWCYCKLKYNCWLDLQVSCWETQPASGAFFFFPVPLPGKSTVKFYFGTLTFCANCVQELLGKAPLAQNKAEVSKGKSSRTKEFSQCRLLLLKRKKCGGITK